METRKNLIDKVLIGLDTGINILDEWKFMYNGRIQGIEAYNGNKSVIEHQNTYRGVNENFEKVVERLLEKLGY